MDSSDLTKLKRRLGTTAVIPFSPLHRAVRGRDVAFVRGYLLGEFGVEVPEEAVRVFLQDAERCATTDWRMWLKVRLERLGCFRPGGRSGLTPRLTVPLHVFFACLEETEDQLARLRNEDAAAAVGGPRLQTPGIERTAVCLEPIDRVAARVAGRDD